MIHSLKQKLSLMKRKTVTKVINDQSWTFTPVSLLLLYELRTCLEPVTVAIQTLMAKSEDRDRDGTQTVEKVTRPDGSEETVTHLGSTNIDLARFRADRADKATKDALNAILGQESRLALARILADSLRSNLERPMTDDEALEFFGEIDLPLALEFLAGFLEVNASVFAPFGQRVLGALKEKVGAGTFGRAPAESPAPAPSPNG